MYLIPAPHHIHIGEDTFLLSCRSGIVLHNSCPPESFHSARQLQEAVLKQNGYLLPISRSSRLSSAGNSVSPAKILLSLDSSLSREEYTIHVDGHGVCLTGGSPAGLFYSIQTFRQVLIQCGACIPYMEISDAPDLSDRGFYHDITRGRIPTMEQLKKLADKLAAYKINQLHLYVEHTFLFEGFSEVCRDDTPLTAEDILELDAYCRERFIDLVPSIASFGHFYKVLRTKTWRHLCELPQEVDAPYSLVDRQRHHTLDVTNPESLAFVKHIIDQYMPLFSSRYFNIGADETFDLGKGNSRKLAEEKGTSRLYVDFVRELCGYVVSKGKIPMFWGDIICEFPETICELPPETICLNWGYEPDVDETSTKKLSEAGAKLYNCPGVRGWDQLVNQLGVSYENIRRMSSYAYQYGAIGLLNTDWGDCGHINHPDFSITGLIYGAAVSWNREFPAFEELNRQISLLEFTDRTESIVSVLAEISENCIFSWRDLVNFMEDEAVTPDKIGTKPSPKTEIVLKSASDLADTEKVLLNLDAIARKLYGLIPSLDSSVRPAIKPYLTAIRGMQLFHRTGVVISAREYGTEPVIPSDPVLLASQLELWFMDYEEDWRKVSRESELYRIRNVIHYFADYLREA